LKVYLIRPMPKRHYLVANINLRDYLNLITTPHKGWLSLKI